VTAAELRLNQQYIRNITMKVFYIILMVVGVALVFLALNVMHDTMAIVFALFGSSLVGSGIIARAIATTFEKYLEKM